MLEKNEENMPSTSGLLGRIRNWLKPIGELRDGALVLVSVTYITGYMVWSLNAWVNQLGVLPVIDSQYFVAGFVPVSILLLAYFGGTQLRRLIEQWDQLVAPNVTIWWQGLLRLAAIAVFVGSFATLIILSIVNALSESKGTTYNIFRVVIVIWGISFIFLPPINEVEHPNWLQSWLQDWFGGKGFRAAQSWFRKLMSYYVIFALTLLGLFYYLFIAYPNLPQELGGVRPRCGYLDVPKAQLSNETLEAIVPANLVKSDHPVVRSMEVEILFSGSDVILIRSRGTVYEIKRSNVSVIRACD